MRKFKLLVSFMIFVGLLGGVGYGIYSAIVNQPSEIALSVDGQIIKIADFVPDYDKIAEGVAMNLPTTDEALLALGISKEGHTFDCWTYDARGTQVIENGIVVKKQGKQTIYLKWKKKDFKVYKVALKDEYAENFDFRNFGNLDYYASINNGGDGFAPSIVQYEDYEVLTTFAPSEVGYEYTWLKWTGEGTCELDEQGVPVYYSQKCQIKEDVTFVRCKMPKKYTITYKYRDEQNNIVTVGQKNLIFNKTADTIVRPTSDLDCNRTGYNITNYQLVKPNSDEMQTISQSQIIDESIISFTGNKITEFDCFVNYDPRLYQITVKGYADNEIITENGNEAISHTETIPYYSNVENYLQDLLNNTSYLMKNYLIFNNKFTLANNTSNVPKTMPAENLEIHAHYTIKKYNVLFALKLKDKTLILNQKDSSGNYINPIRYGLSFDPNIHLYDFQYALDNDVKIDVVKSNVTIATYSADEYEFTDYTIKSSLEDLEDNSNVLADNVPSSGLTSVSQLADVRDNVYVVINTIKVRFFVEFINKTVMSNYVNDETKWEHCARKEIFFKEEYDNVAMFYEQRNSDVSAQYYPTTSPNVTNPSASKKSIENSQYEFGGWKCENEEVFGELAYLDYGLEITKDDILQLGDDVVVAAEWYYNGIDSTSWSSAWRVEWNSDGVNSLTITGYSGMGGNIAIPSSLTVQANNQTQPITGTVTRIGDGQGSIINSSRLVIRKILIPTTVTAISQFAFASYSNNTQIRFSESSKIEGEPLTIEKFAFAPLMIAGQNDVENVSNLAAHLGGINSIYLPKRLTLIEEGAFARCSNLKNVEVSKENTAYFVERKLDSQNNESAVLMQNNHTETSSFSDYTGYKIITYCYAGNAVDYVIENVTRIGDYAFSQNAVATRPSLRKIIVSNSNNKLISIGEYAFAYIEFCNSIELDNLPLLNSLGTNIFFKSFNSQDNSSPQNFRFRAVSFDFNGLDAIPDKMFYQTNNLVALNLKNAGNINKIGDGAFYNCGFSFSSNYTANRQAFLNEEYVQIKEGLIDFLENKIGFNIEVYNSLETKNAVKEYFQSFIVNNSNSFQRVGYQAFEGSMISIYVNTDMLVDEYVEPILDSYCFSKTNIYSATRLTVRGDITISSGLRKMKIKNATIGAYVFRNTTLNSLGIHFIDCLFEGGDNDPQKSTETFANFQINCLESEEFLTEGLDNPFDFIVELSGDYSLPEVDPDIRYVALKYVFVPHLFSNMIIPRSNFVFRSEMTINAEHNFGPIFLQASLQKIQCKTISLTKVLDVSGTTFATAENTANENRDPNSATKITFINCSFVMTKEVFRSLMFFQLGRLTTIEFLNCPNICEEYRSNIANYLTLKTYQYQNLQPENIVYDEIAKNLTINFFIEETGVE